MRKNATMKASVCFITKRKNPRVSELLQCLGRQTCLDFELIVVDGYYYSRKSEMMSTIRKAKTEFEILYVPPKPTRWGSCRPDLANARNTALVWARGTRVICIDDCCVDMCPDLIERHLQWAGCHVAVLGTWLDDTRYEGRYRMLQTAQYVNYGLFYGTNCSYDVCDAVAVNGYEELLDGEQGQEDCLLAVMLSRIGVKLFYEPALWVRFDTKSHTLTQASPDPEKATWGSEPGIVGPKKRRMDDGTLRYANEWLGQETIKDRDRQGPLGNHFRLSQLRQIPHRCKFEVMRVHNVLGAYVDPDPNDWRDDEPLVNILAKAQHTGCSGGPK